jgi:hypothetical protein
VGSALGSLAIYEAATVPARLAAGTDVSVLTLSNDALERLHSDHPRLAASLYRAAAEALAAEYRWTAAENLAVTR